MPTETTEDVEMVTCYVARCRFCPASRIWDSGYRFKASTAERLYLLHLQSTHPARYAKMIKRRVKESGE